MVYNFVEANLMIKKMLVLSSAILLSGCFTPSMSSVMSNCDSILLPKISDFNSCIQSDYKREWGLYPGHKDVRSLYDRLDLIVEDQQSGKMTQTQAKALAYKAYDDTVGAVMAAAAADKNTTCKTYGNSTQCY